jgi:hypothetical protein
MQNANGKMAKWQNGKMQDANGKMVRCKMAK